MKAVSQGLQLTGFAIVERDMYTRADKHIDDQRSKWKETELMINKAPKPFFQKHTIYLYIECSSLRDFGPYLIGLFLHEDF